MGYIQELETKLKEMLSALDEKKQKEVIKYVKEKALESYRNGIISTRLVDADKEAKEKSRRFGRGK